MSDPAKRQKLEKIGIQVRNISTGKLRDFNDIMLDIAVASRDIKKADYINTVFGSESVKAIRAYGSEFAKRLPELIELGDTAGKIEEKSATMAQTMKSNLQNLQTAFTNFADINLTKPLSGLTEALNKLSEDPERVEKVFYGFATGLGAIAAVKGIAGISRLIGSLSQLKSGKVSESFSMASAMPVYVTNWGGAAGVSAGAAPGASLGAPAAGTPLGGGLLDQYGKPVISPPKTPAALPVQAKPSAGAAAVNAVKNLSAKKLAGGAATAGVIAAVIEIPQILSELEAIKNNTEMTDKERGKAKGGAVGDAAGSIAGAAVGGAAGVAAGAVVGSAVPVLGTAAGALVGMGIGALGMWIGGKAGRAIGEGIGEAAANDKATAGMPERGTAALSTARNRRAGFTQTRIPAAAYADANRAPAAESGTGRSGRYAGAY